MKLKFFLFTIWVFILLSAPKTAFSQEQVSWWQFQSIDTMKYSRDTAKEKLTDPSFDEIIDSQIQKIAETGVTHVAIATPYDEEFIPFLKRWVSIARENGLHVWFRGNFSGWEKWFDYPAITASDHLQKTEQFIISHPDLFADGDIFSSCPECENGQLGDPRNTGQVSQYRQFIISEYQIADKAFKSIKKKVAPNYFSMNGDVAKLIMDKETTQAIGGIVVIDHYVATADRLVEDINYLLETSGGKIVLGEFGVPIPDINGEMTEEEQKQWLENALYQLTKIKKLVGINYWVGFGGSTSLWNDDGTPKLAVETVRSYYSPQFIIGHVLDGLGRGINNTLVSSPEKEIVTDNNGLFVMPYLSSGSQIKITKEGYKSKQFIIGSQKEVNIYLEKENENENFFQKLFRQLLQLFGK